MKWNCYINILIYSMFNELFFSEIDFLKGNKIWIHEKLQPFLNWQHHKLHHSWLVVHHKLHHSWLGVHQKLHHPCYTYQDLSHYFEKNILSVLMKYHKFNAKIWHLFTFISIYCSSIVNWNLIMIYANNGHIWNDINTYLQYV